MSQKVFNFLVIVGIIALLGGIVTGIVALERYRYHTFLEVTHSDISYFQWKLTFDSGKK